MNRDEMTPEEQVARSKADTKHDAGVRVGDQISQRYRVALDSSAERAQELSDAHVESTAGSEPLATHSEAEVRAFIEGVQAARRSVA